MKLTIDFGFIFSLLLALLALAVAIAFVIGLPVADGLLFSGVYIMLARC